MEEQNVKIEEKNVVVAVIICDRKESDIDMAIPRLIELNYTPFRLYINIQSSQPVEKWINKISDMIKKSGRDDIIFDYDVWNMNSSWLKQPQFDQDNNWRIDPITIARNMCINYARRNNATHLMFVDADVVVPKDSIERLLEHKLPLVGGLVPSRGNEDKENTFYYAFQIVALPDKSKAVVSMCQKDLDKNQDKKLIRVDYATMGFLMIERKLFRNVSVRYDMEFGMVDDPAFALDAKTIFNTNWIIDISLIAEQHASLGAAV